MYEDKEWAIGKRVASEAKWWTSSRESDQSMRNRNFTARKD
jgi:hypothetical protein